MADRAFRATPDSPASGGLPDARLAQRGRRRRPGGLASAQSRRHQQRREPSWVVDHGGGTGVPEHAAHARVAARGAPRRAHARPDHQPPGRGRPRAGSVAGRLGRPGAAGGARHADAGRAARLRAARHVRRAVRGDRPDDRASRSCNRRVPRSASATGPCSCSPRHLPPRSLPATLPDTVDSELVFGQDQGQDRTCVPPGEEVVGCGPGCWRSP